MLSLNLNRMMDITNDGVDDAAKKAAEEKAAADEAAKKAAEGNA